MQMSDRIEVINNITIHYSVKINTIGYIGWEYKKKMFYVLNICGRA